MVCALGLVRLMLRIMVQYRALTNCEHGHKHSAERSASKVTSANNFADSVRGDRTSDLSIEPSPKPRQTG